MLERGYVQLYTGHGKGKTTAALGLALRAAGAGLKTIVIQFMKGQSYSELEAVKALGGAIVIEQYGSPLFCRPDDVNIDEHVALANKALTRSLRSSSQRIHHSSVTLASSSCARSGSYPAASSITAQ